MDEMRAILDSLMGADRNNVSALGRPNANTTFKGRGICHYYLIDFCPHDLFPNTKSDIGPCRNKHSDALREDFLADPDYEIYLQKYEREFMDELQRLLDSVEIRIKKGNERILGPDGQTVQQEKQRKTEAMKEEVALLLKKAQEAGEKGNINEAEQYARRMTEIRCDLDRMAAGHTDILACLSAQEKSLRVCSVCGAMQSLGDATSRFESHVSGKQHVGYERVRLTLATLKEKHAKYKEDENQLQRSRSSRSPRTSKDHHHHRRKTSEGRRRSRSPPPPPSSSNDRDRNRRQSRGRAERSWDRYSCSTENYDSRRNPRRYYHSRSNSSSNSRRRNDTMGRPLSKDNDKHSRKRESQNTDQALFSAATRN